MNETEDRDPSKIEEPSGAEAEPSAVESIDEAPAEAAVPSSETPADAAESSSGEQAPAPAQASAAGEPEGEKPKAAGRRDKAAAAPAAPQQPPGAHLEPDVAPVEERSRPLDEEAEVFARYAEPEPVEGEEAEPPEEEEAELEVLAPLQRLQADARFAATGKRKTSVARVILKLGTGDIVVNGKPYAEVFPRATLQAEIRRPLELTGNLDRLDVTARLHGGGVSSQAAALRHGIARALVEADPELRKPLKRRGMLTRDARIKERRKAGLKKARKRPQFSKR